MTEELVALETNQTQDVVPPPPGVLITDSKWVYSFKLNPDETLATRLVVPGYKQEYGIDYHETFAPVANMTTVRILIAVVTARNCPLYQMDVKNTFLHGDLEATIYMKPPLGYSTLPVSMCHLKKKIFMWFKAGTLSMVSEIPNNSSSV